ncbi:MAG: cation transporter [Lachnospiraceae bacterium]|nr:cation transporter [Lachnospiraceae bacterium]
MKQKSGKRTMFMSVLMSAPGPLIVGAGLMVGKSTTQLADFLRRSAELLALIVAFIVYSMTGDGEADSQSRERKARLERNSNLFVGAMMCISGSAMLLITLLSNSTEKGNVIPGLAVAVLGVIANSLFWRKYTKLNKQEPNAILAVQSRLYRAKALVDICVTTALGSVALFPEAQFSYYLDKVGSVIVAVYLAWCGIKTMKENTGR